MPAEKIGVAWAARTSTLEMQDPVTSLRRQYRNSEASLPDGFQIVAWYWDIESGALDLADRSQGQAWQQVAADLGIPRDGGITELLADAAGPAPRFAVVVCEDISHVARDNLASLMVEKDLARCGIPIFAADEPAEMEGASPTTLLVRRIKMGTSEFYRLQMLGLCWDGLVQHAIDGWNIGPAPYGYCPDRHQHPAAQSRPGPDPHPADPRPRTRPRRHPASSTGASTTGCQSPPSPGNSTATRSPTRPAPGWTEPTVSAILRNPKYTGYMVYGRHPRPGATRPAKPARPVPPDQWIWSPEPRHQALTTLETWQAAQATGAERGNVRDADKPTTQPGTRYALRSRIRHEACQHRMYGIRRPSSSKASPGAVYTYYHCPYNPSNPPRRRPPRPPRHSSRSAKKPSSPPSPASWTSTSSATTAPPCSPPPSPPTTPSTPPPASVTRPGYAPNWPASTPPRPASSPHWSNSAPTPAPSPGLPPTPLRPRRRTPRRAHHHPGPARQPHRRRHPRPGPRPARPTALPGQPVPPRPAALIEALLNALDIQVLYRPEQEQATIWATLTDTTPATITALLNDPRVTASQPGPQPPAQPSTSAPVSESAQGPIWPKLATIMVGAGIGGVCQVNGVTSFSVVTCVPR